MKILLVAPHLEHRARGNLTTAFRWASGLRRAGVDVTLVSANELEGVGDQPFDLVHAHHALHAGPAARVFAARRDLPLLISVGGTDLDGANGEGPDDESLASFRAADGLCGPFPSTEIRLRNVLEAAPPYFRVRRGVAMPARPALLRTGAPLRLLLAGALRPVKGQDLAITWLDQLRDAGIPAELVLAGPALDDAWSRSIAERAQGREDLRWIGEVEPSRMRHLFGEVDLVLNCSRHEGASNVVLEAWAAGRPVVLRRAPGNTELAEGAPATCARLLDAEDETGLADFAKELLADDPEQRRRRRNDARAFVRLHHRERFEIEELHVAYRTVVNSAWRRSAEGV